jgi:hypothetical protein
VVAMERTILDRTLVTADRDRRRRVAVIRSRRRG